MKIITVTNRKGGVGKSTTALSLAQGLAKNGQRTLLIDLEAQCNTTGSMLGSQKPQKTALDIFRGTPIEETICNNIHGLDFIPGEEALGNADKMFLEPSDMYILKEQMQRLADADIYDFCVIDTPPSLGFVTLTALASANECIVPMNPDTYSEQGTVDLTKAIGSVRKYLQNPDLKVAGILITRLNSKSKFAKGKIEEIVDYAKILDTKLYDTKIRECVKIPESQDNMVDIYEYAPKSNAAVDYDNFVTEFLKKQKVKPKASTKKAGKKEDKK
jgi:chromosome partitioning protein